MSQAKTKKRKIRIGTVTSDKMQKTITVKVVQPAKHSRYGRIIKRYNKFKAQDEKNQAKVGNLVKIEESRPISRDKRWRLIEVLK